MCYKCQKSEMAGLREDHLSALAHNLDHDALHFAGHVYRGWTGALVPHLPILPMFVAMYESWRNEDFGVLGAHRLVRTPLSVIGNNKVRYRTPIVELLHETVLSARMSDLAVDEFRKEMKVHGLCVLFLCSCGVVFGKCEDVKAFYGSETHRTMDKLRSAIDAEGNPVVEVEAWEDIPAANMDLHANGAELRMFHRMEELLHIAATESPIPMPWITPSLDTFVEAAGYKDRVAA